MKARLQVLGILVRQVPIKAKKVAKSVLQLELAGQVCSPSTSDACCIAGAKKQAVWTDPEDEKLEVNLAGNSRNKKLLKQVGETVINGVEYEKRLREQHRCGLRRFLPADSARLLPVWMANHTVCLGLHFVVRHDDEPWWHCQECTECGFQSPLRRCCQHVEALHSHPCCWLLIGS